ncbi:hypothetical protein PIB30_048231 [Stylosanthes scabra]|uniref:Uncharacterized protein n=1 Tax=Stylosanthes scabra TaxID=79078 RepID=A0ABU6WIY9_9FABA|nr:hypothetical protein [Stylosanthes scabra]
MGENLVETPLVGQTVNTQSSHASTLKNSDNSTPSSMRNPPNKKSPLIKDRDNYYFSHKETLQHTDAKGKKTKEKVKGAENREGLQHPYEETARRGRFYRVLPVVAKPPPLAVAIFPCDLAAARTTMVTDEWLFEKTKLQQLLLTDHFV